MAFSPRWISGPELRLTLRLLRKQPVVTLTTLLALTVGIGMATVGFTMLDAVLYSRLPFPNGDRFVLVEAHEEPELARHGLEPARFRVLGERATAFEHLGAFRAAEVNLRLDSGEIAPVRAAFITPDSIRVFPHGPVAGRLLNAGDGVPGAPAVALIRESLWRRHFSADPQIVGRAATFSGVPRTIVGVMPDTFLFPSGEAWLPLTDTTQAMTFGVLRSNREPAVATAEAAALSAQFEREFPSAPKLRVAVVPFTEAVSRGVGLLAVVLVSCLVLVLLVIAASIGNLVLARTAARSRELAVRTALGATRARLVLQTFSEVLVIGVAAAAIGLTASSGILWWVTQTMTDMPFWVDFSASPRTMGFVAFTTLLASGVAGVLPALKATRGDTAAALAGSRTSSTGLGKAGGVMVAVQVAVSIALLNGALLMARGVAGYMSPSVLVPPHEILTARVVTDRATVSDVVDAAARINGVADAGAASSLPGLSPATQMTELEPLPGERAAPARPAPVVELRAKFLETLGASARAGRLFTAADFAPDATPVAIVNEPFVRKFLGGASPVGRRLRTLPERQGQQPSPWREIVGVVPDLGLSAGDETMAAGFYVPMAQTPMFYITVRAPGDAQRLGGPLRHALAAIDPGIQVRDVMPLQDVGREDRAVFAGIGAALGALGGMALLLSVIGMYAVLSLAVTRRTREIGIRAALGATKRQVVQSIVGRVAVPPAVGAALGMALGVLLASARGIFAFRLPESSGPWGLPLLAAVMIAAGVIAAWVPARRAVAIQPADALRSE